MKCLSNPIPPRFSLGDNAALGGRCGPLGGCCVPPPVADRRRLAVDAPRPNPSQIMQVGMGFFASRTLLSAVELNLFGTLAAGPLDLATLRARLGLHERAAADFLDALVALGFLRRDGDGTDARYANTTDTAAFLDPASPTYLGG